MKESSILYDNGPFWVGQTKIGFVVYRSGVTHSTRVATIGLSLGLQRAIEEADKRKATACVPI